MTVVELASSPMAKVTVVEWVRRTAGVVEARIRVELVML